MDVAEGKCSNIQKRDWEDAPTRFGREALTATPVTNVRPVLAEMEFLILRSFQASPKHKKRAISSQAAH